MGRNEGREAVTKCNRAEIGSGDVEEEE